MNTTSKVDGDDAYDAYPAKPAPPAYSDVDYPSTAGTGGPWRGVLASPGRLWDTSQWRQASVGHDHGVHVHVHAPHQRREPGPPGPPEAVVQAHRYKCSVCGYLSFLRPEDVGPYIKCPHCRVSSATNQPDTRRAAIRFLVGGVLALLVVLGAFVSFPIIMSSSSHGDSNAVIWAVIALVMIVAFISMAVLCTCSTVYFRVPVSTIYAEQVPYQLSQDEYATLPP